MRFTSILSSALLAATALAAPPTSGINSLPAVLAAQAHGVDPMGPIPEGATELPNGGFAADPNTQAWYWILAQLEMLESEHGLHKRQANSGLAVATFATPDCQGQVMFYPDMVFGVTYDQPRPVMGVRLVNRPIFPVEQLNIFRFQEPHVCGPPLPPLGPDTRPGCQPVQFIGCLRLTRR